MFQFSSTPLEQFGLREGAIDPSIGAFSSFEGFVRNQNNGKQVIALEYEAAEELCQKEAEKILGEAKEKFGVIDLRCYHRVGKLMVGEMAVWVGISAGHRDEAFKACRYVIDEIKKRLPIWKKEYYTEGDSGWVGCEPRMYHVPRDT